MVPEEKYPILLVPGLCASKLDAVSRTTGEKVRAWINGQIFPKPEIDDIFTNMLWGTTNPNGYFQSFIDRYATIQPVPGLNGCDYLIDNAFVRLIQHLFAPHSLGAYFHTMIHRLTKFYGYEGGKTLFAFCYDWRQDVSSNLILDCLTSLLEYIQTSNHGKKIIIIAHSLGGVLVRTYMSSVPNWPKYIRRFCALGSPFDGSSGYNYQGIINGYNLSVPFMTDTAAHNLSAKSTTNLFIGNKPLTIVDDSCYFTSCVYIKRLDKLTYDPRDDNSLTRREIMRSPVTVQHCKPKIVSRFEMASTLRQQSKFISIVLDFTKYKNRIPDIAAIILENFLITPDLIATEFQKCTYEMLLRCIRPAVIKKVVGVKRPSPCHIQEALDKVLQPNFTDSDAYPTPEGIEDRYGTWRWEAYSLWPQTGRQNSLLMRQHPWFVVTAANKLELRSDAPFQNIIRTGTFSSVAYFSMNKELVLLASAMSIYRSITQNTQPLPKYLFVKKYGGFLSSSSNFVVKVASNAPERLGNISKCMCHKTVLYQYGTVPWSDVLSYPEAELPVLTKTLNHSRTIYHYLFSQPQTLYNHMLQQRLRPLIPPEAYCNGTCLSTSTRGSSGSVRPLSASVTTRVFSSENEWSNNTIPDPYMYFPENGREAPRPIKHTHYSDQKSLKIRYPKSMTTTDEFRFASIVGSGVPTALHTFYAKPVTSNTELSIQLPVPILGDGDGTVCISSSLGDGFDACYVIDRVVVPRVSHPELVFSNVVWKHLKAILNLKRVR